MSISRFLALGSIAALLLLASCGKPEKNDESKPVVAKETTKTEKKADLFDEYYEDEKKETAATDTESEKSEELVEDKSVDKTEETTSDLVEEINEDETDDVEKTEPDFDPNGRYVAQISCIASEAIAEDVAKKLENSGYPVYVAEVINPTPQLLGTYYRVRVGGFATISAAKYFGENFLLKEGYSYWIDNRSNDNVGIGDYGLGGASSDIFEEDTKTEMKSVTTTETTNEFTVEPVTKTEVKEEVDVKEVVTEVKEVVTEVKEIKEVVDTIATVVKETVAPVTTDTTSSTGSNDNVENTNNDDWGSSDW